MRILHTSDWHLGQYFYGKSRAKEHQQFLTWLIEQVKKHQVDAIIVAGDIFDTATPPSYARQIYFDFITRLQSVNCQLIIVAGNHDSASMLTESKALLGALSTHVVANVTDIKEKNNLAEQVFVLTNDQNTPKAVICAVPYIRQRDVIKSVAGQSATEKSKSLQQAIDDHYHALYAHAKQLVQDSRLNLPIIATGHLTALGASVSDSVREIYIGTLEALPSQCFPAADYIALGHIHRAQKVAKTEHIRYSGSPIPLSFDEAKQNKQVLLVDFTKAKLDAITQLTVPCFQPLAMVKTSIDKLDEDIAQLVKNLSIHSDKTADSVNEEEQKIWLDIELSGSELLGDLQAKIIDLVKGYPVEVLLVRRSPQERKQFSMQQIEESTLSELTLDEVFLSRLNQEGWLANHNADLCKDENCADSDDSVSKAQIAARKQQLHTLFKKAVAQVLENEAQVKEEAK